MKHYLQTRNNDNYDLFDVFDDFFRPTFYEATDLKTNIKETDEGYELDIVVPGYNKDQIKVSLENGYLTVSCNKEQKEEDEKKHFVRREINESCQRSYYVGDDVTQDAVKAKYENGILTLNIPKSAPKQIQNHFIDIQ